MAQSGAGPPSLRQGAAPPPNIGSAGSAGSEPPTPSSGSGRAALRGDVQQWEVQWHELQIERPIGQGSFGWVYLAQWHQTYVAAKILTKQGEPAARLLPARR